MKKYSNSEQGKRKGFIGAHAAGFIIGILIVALLFISLEVYMNYKDRVVRYYFDDGSYTDVVDGYYADATYPSVTGARTTAPDIDPVTPNG